MTRQIKFRAWNKELKRFVYFMLGELFKGGLGYGEIDEFEIHQFTGLLDKNGKEIYEGDIVENNDYKWELYWSDKNACYNMARDGKRAEKGNDPLFIDESQYSEIIGNIWENKDLLK